MSNSFWKDKPRGVCPDRAPGCQVRGWESGPWHTQVLQPAESCETNKRRFTTRTTRCQSESKDVQLLTFCRSHTYIRGPSHSFIKKKIAYLYVKSHFGAWCMQPLFSACATSGWGFSAGLLTGQSEFRICNPHCVSDALISNQMPSFSSSHHPASSSHDAALTLSKGYDTIYFCSSHAGTLLHPPPPPPHLLYQPQFMIVQGHTRGSQAGVGTEEHISAQKKHKM